MTTAEAECDHRGWALWLDHCNWWCGRCGEAATDGSLICDLHAHQPGEVYTSNEDREERGEE